MGDTTNLVLPNSADVIKEETDKAPDSEGYVSLYDRPVMNVFFAGEKLVNFSSVCERIRAYAVANYAGNPPSKGVQLLTNKLESLIVRQADAVHPSERRALLREALHQAQQIVKVGNMGFEVVFAEEQPDADCTEDPLSPGALGFSFKMQQQRAQPSVIQPASGVPRAN